MKMTPWRLLRNCLHRPCNVVCFTKQNCPPPSENQSLTYHIEFSLSGRVEINIKIHLLQVVKSPKNNRWNLQCYTSCDHNSYFTYIHYLLLKSIEYGSKKFVYLYMRPFSEFVLIHKMKTYAVNVNGSAYCDPWPMWPIQNCDPFDPLTHDPLTHCLLWPIVIETVIIQHTLHRRQTNLIKCTLLSGKICKINMFYGTLELWRGTKINSVGKRIPIIYYSLTKEIGTYAVRGLALGRTVTVDPHPDCD